MYYAVHHWYGLRTLSSADRLQRFETREERNKAVENDPFTRGNYHLESVTRKQAQRDFPNAFRLTDDPCSYERWDDNTWNCGPTSGRYKYV